MANMVNQTIWKHVQVLLGVVGEPSVMVRQTIHRYQSLYPGSFVYIPFAADTNLYEVWNKLLQSQEVCLGQFITNANDDDRRRYDCLEQHSNFLFSNPEYDIVASPVRVATSMNELDTWEGCQNCHVAHATTSDYEVVVPLMFNYDEFGRISSSHNIPHSAPMWRSNIHREHSFFDLEDDPFSDFSFWLRLLQHGHRMWVIKEPLSLFLDLPNVGSYGLQTRTTQQRVHEKMCFYADRWSCQRVLLDTRHLDSTYDDLILHMNEYTEAMPDTFIGAIDNVASRLILAPFQLNVSSSDAVVHLSRSNNTINLRWNQSILFEWTEESSHLFHQRNNTETIFAGLVRSFRWHSCVKFNAANRNARAEDIEASHPNVWYGSLF
jgi:hypothetical protein